MRTLCAAMESTKTDKLYAADHLIQRYGATARQKVVDEIVVAVRNHDLETAKMWDEIGRFVDERLTVPADQLSFL